MDKSIRVVVDVARPPMILVEEKGSDGLLASVTNSAARTLITNVKRTKSLNDRTSMAGLEMI